ncbi:MAG: AAA family ATPase [Bosea sp.]|uniref:AAA family ATPase n=1 Tax=Bosea sp. (in: a-proteobacteria) TaxID=1871050 RepID=UPI001AC53287|nr:AAA family ATPase [Bosea sp. (in: a-proteobacteria)]MBN9454283.1 AAA family ATPase [Bosea sp. (in: a-proteobacteria)]
MMSLNAIAKALGGVVSSGQVMAPGPGHRPHDRSMAVKIGEGGNLIVHSHAGDDAMKCKAYVEQRLGIVWQPERGDADGAAQAIDRMQARASKANGHHNGNGPQSQPVDNRQASALKLWAEAVDPRGTIVETYLASRRLELPDGVAMSTIRFHPACPFGPGVRLPCMVAAMRSIETGAIVAIHRTALTEDGRKLDRKMLGPADGSAIMLGELDAERGALTVGEGIESALSGLMMGYAPAWAMGTAGGIAKLPVLHGVDSLTILGEHDGGASAKAIRQVGCAWREAEREVFIALPKAGMGKDANDAWQKRESDHADVLEVREFGTAPDLDASIEAGNPGIKATPFVLMDPRTIPTRQWLYGRHYVRRFVSTTVAPGGLGKSSLSIVEALSMVTARDLLGIRVRDPLRVWLWNGEDPRDELDRRIAAACLHYEVTAADMTDRLFVDSGRDLPIRLVEMAAGGRVSVAVPTVEGVEQAIRENRIDLLVIDPFVASHGVPENDNGAIDRVAKTWAGIAERCNCAIELVHHVRKTASGPEGYSVEDARGGSSLIGAVRSARVLNAMSKDEAERAGVEPEKRRLHFRVDDGKANMAPPMESASWFRMESVGLGNGRGFEPEDNIGVATAWVMPGVLEHVTAADCERVIAMVKADPTYRADSQAAHWIGYAIGEVLGLDTDTKGGKEQAKRILKIWLDNGALAKERRPDKNRDPRDFIIVGPEGKS